MALSSVKKTATVKSPHTKKQTAALTALEKAARRLGFKVSAGQLRFAGLPLKGGNCVLRGQRWLILDRRQPFEDQVEIYRQALTANDLADCDMPAEAWNTLSPYFFTDPDQAA